MEEITNKVLEELSKVDGIIIEDPISIFKKIQKKKI